MKLLRLKFKRFICLFTFMCKSLLVYQVNFIIDFRMISKTDKVEITCDGNIFLRHCSDSAALWVFGFLSYPPYLFLLS